MPRATLTHDSAIEWWRKIAVSSAKQCGRVVVPALASPVRFDQLLTDATVPLRIMLVEPAVRSAHESLGVLSNQPPPTAVTLAIGPEGGWTKTELEAVCGRGFSFLTLGARTLRAGAAPAAAISVLQFVWGNL